MNSIEAQSLASPVRTIAPDAGREQERLTAGNALCMSGGGYRAMVFHVGALWRLNDAGILPKLNRISSVSGGSITAGVLGLAWPRLDFHAATGVAGAFVAEVVEPIRRLASVTVDRKSVIAGALLPGSISDKVAKAYNRRLFHDATLQDLPTDGAGPRFVINATNVQTGSLWRFSKPYMGDYQVGLIREPKLALATAVAASGAFPPVLSPAVLNLDPDDFDPNSRGALWGEPFNERAVLSDGGVYDNLGLETAFKRYSTVLVSDASQRVAPAAKPAADWGRHGLRVIELIDSQVRSLRKRQLIAAYTLPEGDANGRTGAYWSVRSHFADFQVSDPLGVGAVDTAWLAAVKTRLKAMDETLQEQLINWGYAICDAAIRKHCANLFAIADPIALPYPASGLAAR